MAGVGTGLALVAGLVAGTVVFCVAGVALDDIDVTFVWQMWHLLQTVRFHDGLHGLSAHNRVPWCWHDPFWHNSFASKTLVTYNSWSFTHNAFTRNSSRSETLTRLAFTIQLFYIFPRQLSHTTLHRQFFSPPIFHT